MGKDKKIFIERTDNFTVKITESGDICGGIESQSVEAVLLYEILKTLKRIEGGVCSEKDHSCSASAASKISRTEESKFLDNIREGQKKLKDEKKFNPEHKYGNCLGFACSIDHFDEKKCSSIKKLLITAMEKIVPVEYRKKVLFIVRKFDMGREIDFSWYFDLQYKPEGEDYHGFILENK